MGVQNYAFLLIKNERKLLCQKRKEVFIAGFIEDLYYGNVDTQVYYPEFGAELKKKLNDLTELEKQIADKLSGEEKTMFLKYTDKYIEFTSRSLLDSFTTGFKLGMKCASDIT